jgi:hypothetical protein
MRIVIKEDDHSMSHHLKRKPKESTWIKTHQSGYLCLLFSMCFGWVQHHVYNVLFTF